MDSASIRKILGIVLVIVGICLAYWAYQMSGSVGSQLTEAVTGSPTDRVMIYYIGALVSAAVGVFLLVKK
jgi:uncharacterized membrane protein YidH (DUF202 family)